MAFRIDDRERDALRGLPYVQRLLYYEGIRPYMDYSTGIVGIRRGISYQSLAEELYIDTHQGYLGGSPSKAQIRRALSGLEKSGLIVKIDHGKKLIFKCVLALEGNFIQKKEVMKPSHPVVTPPRRQSSRNTADSNDNIEKGGTDKTIEPVIHPVSGINNKKTPIDENFKPTKITIEKAKQNGCHNADCQESLLHFISFHQSKGTLSANWDAEFLSWLLIGKNFKKKETRNATYSNRNNQTLRGSKAMSAVDRVWQANREDLEQPKGWVIDHGENNQ